MANTSCPAYQTTLTAVHADTTCSRHILWWCLSVMGKITPAVKGAFSLKSANSSNLITTVAATKKLYITCHRHPPIIHQQLPCNRLPRCITFHRVHLLPIPIRLANEPTVEATEPSLQDIHVQSSVHHEVPLEPPTLPNTLSQMIDMWS